MILHKFNIQFILLLLAFIAVSCATPRAPEGGEKDEDGPVLDTLKSTPTLQTNFVKQPIELAFNEWFSLKDAKSQILVSPPLEHKFDVHIKGKKLIFKFDEEEQLRKDATYTINFGQCVQDITENNPSPNLKFVFATGDQIDSLTMHGVIMDAFTGEPVEGALMMLYEEKEDSVVRTALPFYFGRTDASGHFHITNMKEGHFKGFALEDSNNDYKYNKVEERIGFPSGDLHPYIPGDTSAHEVVIFMFQEEQPLRKLKVDTNIYARIKITYDRNIEDYGLTTQAEGLEGWYIEEVVADTLKIWYEHADSTDWTLYLNSDTLYMDTLRIPPRSKANFMEKAKLRFMDNLSGKQKVLPETPIGFRFNFPLGDIDTAQFALFKDSVLVDMDFVLEKDTLESRVLFFTHKGQVDSTYRLEMYPGAVTSIYGFGMKDTITQKIAYGNIKMFGNIILNISGLDIEKNYVIHVLSPDKSITQSYYINGDEGLEAKIEKLYPGKYSLEVIEDTNGNGKWDTGNYKLKLQAEKIWSKEMEQLRANWDLEVEYVLPEVGH